MPESAQLHSQPSKRGTEAGQSTAQRIFSLVESKSSFFVAAFAFIFVVSGLLISATKLMWYDELATYLPAKLPAVRDIWAFFFKGLDVHTPSASLVLHATMAIFGDHHATNRLPMVLSFLLLCLCVYRFVSLRCPPSYAIAAMVFPALTSAGYYATELRPYGIVLGMTGLALVCWQEAAEGRRRVIALSGLFLSLAIALSFHYFAALIWIPFGLAELTRAWIRRRPDPAMWLALLLAPFPLLVFLPAIHTARATYSGGSWARPGPAMIVDTYREFFTLAYGPMLAAGVLWILLSRFRTPERNPSHGPTLPERVLAGSLALLPFFCIPLAYATGIYVSRYALPAVAGLAIFLAFGACRLLRADRLPGTVFALFFLLWFCYKGVTTTRLQAAKNGGLRTPIGEPLRHQKWMEDLAHSELPVAAVPALFFLQVHQYAAEPVRSRIFYPFSESLALRFSGGSTSETNFRLFSQMIPLPVIDYEHFAGANRHFLLCVDTTNPAWQIPKLLEDGARIELIRRDDPIFLFDVTLPLR